MSNLNPNKTSGSIDPTLDAVDAMQGIRRALGLSNLFPHREVCERVVSMVNDKENQHQLICQISRAVDRFSYPEELNTEGLAEFVAKCYVSYKFHRELMQDASGLHAETLALFLQTAKEMVTALANGEKDRPPLAWTSDKWEANCKASIRNKIRDGEYVDAMNYLMFAKHHGWDLTGFGQAKTKSSLREDLCDILSLDRSTATARQILDKVKELSEYASMGDEPAGPVLTYEFATPRDLKNYVGLGEVLLGALHQAAYGKGRERHANDLPFEKQRMQTISDQVGSVDGMAYQVCKKVTEALGLPTFEQQERELFGAINYTAGMLIWLKRQHDADEV